MSQVSRPTERDLRAELDAERAATDHWRRVARQRGDEYTRLRRRPTVRALVAIETKLRPLGRPLRVVPSRVRRTLARISLGAGRHLLWPPGRLDHLSGVLAGLVAPSLDRRRIVVVVVGSSDAPRARLPGTDAVEVLRADSTADPVTSVRRLIGSIDHDLVVIVLETSFALDEGWLRRLVAALHDDTVATVPVLVHPERPRRRATPHDGLVRAAGLVLEMTDEGVPIIRSAGAGSRPDPSAAPTVVAAGSAAGICFDRGAYERAGGLGAADDLDIAIVELCVRLGAQGGRISVVPDSVLVDDRPVRSRADLRSPIDPHGMGWGGVIERCGPTMVRSSGVSGPMRFVLTIAAPSEKVAERWGDRHLADALADSLRRLDHEVCVQTLDRADRPAARCYDVHIVLRGLGLVRRTSGQRHVIWVISHPESIEDDELDAADLVLVASARFADHLRSRTRTPVEVFLQATDHRHFHPRPIDERHAHPVTVVAKTRDVVRPVVADAISVGIRPSIYGGGWDDRVDPALIVTDHVDYETLPIVYSSAGVVLNDHWRTMQAWGFASNRLFDVLACGTPVISDPVEGLAELFDGAVLEYHDPGELRRLVDDVLADPERAAELAGRGRAAVLAGHTFDHRAAQLLAALDRLAPAAS